MKETISSIKSLLNSSALTILLQNNCLFKSKTHINNKKTTQNANVAQ